MQLLYDMQWVYVVRDVLICLVALVCMAGAAVLIQREQRKVAILMILGLALLGLEPVSDFFVWQVLAVSELEYEILDLLFAIPSALGMIGGMVCLTAALLSATRPSTDEPSEIRR